MDKALFGAGCFWGVEDYFQKIPGVLNTKVGYSGGSTINPTYKTVCYENTDHAEVLEIEFNNKIITYEEVLTHFWKCHDPTTKDRQGNDIGRQYRSVIYYYNNEQKKIAEKSKKENQRKYNNNIVTEITKADIFYLAEDYHQNYMKKIKNIL